MEAAVMALNWRKEITTLDQKLGQCLLTFQMSTMMAVSLVTIIYGRGLLVSPCSSNFYQVTATMQALMLK